MEEYTFPKDFIFGAATASYQIEGHPLADGAAPSVWHEFSHIRGKIENNDNGDIACDFYHRYPKDIKMIRDLGCGGFRFSVSWPRVVPEPGKINPKGLDFYDRVVDELLKNGIEPMCTIFHWDTPVWLESMGGFAVRDSVEHIKFFSRALFDRLGDRVSKWVTINEPMVYSVYGYFFGEFPPGRKYNFKGFFKAVHFQLLAHAEIVRAYRETGQKGKIGISQAQVWMSPFREGNPKDEGAAATMDAIVNRMYIDPQFFGSYPERVLEIAGKRFPAGFERDLPDMREPGDFVGINYYMRQSYKHSPFIPLTRAKMIELPGAESSEMWEVYPEGLYNLLIRLRDEYGNPECYITENGYPLPEKDGVPITDDAPRISYLARHIRQAARALEDGVTLKGFYVWSLMDNFEWAFGYRMRFGLIRTDFTTLERTWKRSAYWYKDLVAKRAI